MAEKILRYYRNKIPKKEDIVIARIMSKSNNFGYNVELLEYNNISGFITLSQLSRRSRHRKKKLVKIGQILPMIVIDVDEKKNIDLSKKYIKSDEIEKYLNIFNQKQNFHRLGYEIWKLYCNFTEEEKSSDDVFEHTIWKIYDEIEEQKNYSYNKHFIKILNNPNKLFNSEGSKKYFNKKFISLMCQSIKDRIIKKDCILSLEVMVKILDERGVQSLKEIFNLEKYSKTNKININLSALPIYEIIIEGQDKDKIKKILEEIKDIIKKRTYERYGLFSANDNIMILKENEISLKFIPKYNLKNMILN